MSVRLHTHAWSRLKERGGSEEEVKQTVLTGERFVAKHGRVGFRRNFSFNDHWQGKYYSNRQVEAYAVEEAGDWLVITVIVKYF
jgi:hypothetical protein